LYRFIAGKKILSRNLCRFIKGIHKLEPILSLHRCRKTFFGFLYCFIGEKNFGQQNFIASSMQENLFLVFSIASSVEKISANKIVSLYSIFFLKIDIALIDTFLSIAAHLCK
jgi:hypothetical protein